MIKLAKTKMTKTPNGSFSVNAPFHNVVCTNSIGKYKSGEWYQIMVFKLFPDKVAVFTTTKHLGPKYLVLGTIDKLHSHFDDIKVWRL